MTRRDFTSVSAGAAGAAANSLALDTLTNAPRFKAKTLEGHVFDNASLKGKVVLIQLWATWCGYCRKDQPAVDEITEEFKDQGLVVLAVNAGENKRKVRAYLESNPRACHIVLMEDTNLAAAFAARGYPKYVVINREGKIVKEQEGAGGLRALRYLVAAAGLS